MRTKSLSIVIPTYNTELYLARCLDSLFYDPDIVENLDVIVVNDGSVDHSLKIAEHYQKQHPGSLTIINKENGGHGSAVSAGVEKAKGKYLKVIDSDDWVNIDDFSNFIKILQDVDEDIIVTNYQEDRLFDSSVIKFDFFLQRKNEKNNSEDTIKDSIRYDIEEIADSVKEPDFFFKFSMHSMAVKLKSLRKVWGNGLLNGTFYVDQQYVEKALECAKDFRILDLNIYRYFIGRPEQSVGMEGFFRHRKDHERVLRWLIKKSKELKDREYLQTALKRQIELMLNTHYEIYYQNLRATNEEIAELLAFDAFVQNEIPDIGKRIAAAENIRRRLASWRRTLKRKLLT